MRGRSTAHRGVAVAAWHEIGGQRIYCRSKAEARHARHLEMLRSAGVIASWEHEPVTFRFERAKNGAVSYRPDFRVAYPDGRVEFHEVKGYLDARSASVLVRMARYYPHETVIVIGLRKGYTELRARMDRARGIGLREQAREAKRAAQCRVTGKPPARLRT